VTRIALIVYVDMEPGDTTEAVVRGMSHILDQTVRPYNPVVELAPASVYPLDDEGTTAS
jgi:hypothetical protein